MTDPPVGSEQTGGSLSANFATLAQVLVDNIILGSVLRVFVEGAVFAQKFWRGLAHDDC